MFYHSERKEINNNKNDLTFYIPIHGTWAIDDNETAWWKPASNFAKYASNFGIVQFDTLPPFIWSSDLNGVFYNLYSKGAKHTDWRAGGWSLYYYLNQVPYSQRNLIVHSHGLQPVMYCASFGMPIRNIISVCSPIRKDMESIMEKAVNYISNWIHIYSNSDKVQWLGQIGDGRWFGSRKAKFAKLNIPLHGINHSDLFKLDGRLDLWNTGGWFNYLRMDTAFPAKEQINETYA